MPPTLRLSRLPPAQRALFPRLSFLRPGFVLYGGTAVALQTGHRDSEDFDFFSSEPLPEAAKRSLAAEFAERPLEVLQDTGDTLTLDVGPADAAVRLSFFGRIRVPRLDLPCAAATGPRVASRLDLAGFKLAMAYQRHEENDVADVAALLESGTTLAEAVGAMRRIYGDHAPVGAAVAALGYFEGRTPSPQGALSQDRRVTIERAVASWRGEIPELPVEDPDLSAPGFREAVAG